jgi:hypothetical protein
MVGSRSRWTLLSGADDAKRDAALTRLSEDRLTATGRWFLSVRGYYHQGTMTTREKLHLLVDELSDVEAEAALARLVRERELLGQWTASEVGTTEDAWALGNAREAIREEPW